MAGYQRFNFYSRDNEGLVGGMFRTLTGRQDTFDWGDPVGNDEDEDGFATPRRRPRGLFTRPTRKAKSKDVKATIIMPDVNLLPPGWSLSSVRGLMDHQMAAAMYGTIDVDSFESGQITKAMTRILDEARIQGRMSYLYPGSKDNFRSMNKHGVDLLSKRMEEATQAALKVPITEEVDVVEPLLLGINAASADPGLNLDEFFKGHPWAEDLAYTVEELKPDISKAEKAYSVDDVYDIAQDVMKRLKIDDPPDPAKKESPKPSFKSLLSRAMDKGDKPEPEGDGEGGGGGAAKARVEGGFRTAKDMMETEVEPSSEKMRELINKKFDDDLRNPKKSGLLVPIYQPDAHAARVQDVTTDVQAEITGDMRSCYAEMLGKIGRYISPLRSALRIHLLSEARTRHRYDQEAGDLCQKTLYQVAQKTSSRVFQVSKIGKSKKTLVTILVDYSGSMGSADGPSSIKGYTPESKGGGSRDKSFHAAMAACAMAEALRGMPGIKTEVASFTAYDRLTATTTSTRNLRLQHRIYKSHNKNDLSGIADMMLDGGRRSENVDGESVRWAARRMLEIPADRRILIVLSDGYPAGGLCDHTLARRDLRSAVVAVEAAGIETIGIGIKTNAVKSFYPKYTVINDVSDLVSTSLRSLIDAINGEDNTKKGSKVGAAGVHDTEEEEE